MQAIRSDTGANSTTSTASIEITAEVDACCCTLKFGYALNISSPRSIQPPMLCRKWLAGTSVGSRVGKRRATGGV